MAITINGKTEAQFATTAARGIYNLFQGKRCPTAPTGEYTGCYFRIMGDAAFMFEPMDNGFVGLSYAPEGDYATGPSITLTREDARKMWEQIDASIQTRERMFGLVSLYGEAEGVQRFSDESMDRFNAAA